MTKFQFLSAYKAQLIMIYGHDWAKGEKLEQFMASIARIIGADGSPSGNMWNHDSEIARKVWKAFGLPRKTYSLKALRALEAS